MLLTLSYCTERGLKKSQKTAKLINVGFKISRAKVNLLKLDLHMSGFGKLVGIGWLARSTPEVRLKHPATLNKTN